MKKLAMLLILVSASASAGMWQLINQQFEGQTWYCTYQLQGTSIVQTIASRFPCQTAIFKY